MRSGGDAQRPSGTEIGNLFDRFQIVVELLIAVVGPVGHPDVTAAVNLETVRQVEFAELLARLLAAGLRDEAAVLVVLHDAIVAVAVGDEDVALRIEADIARAAEDVLLRRRVRTRRRYDGAIDRRWPAADHHQHLAVRAELGDQVGAFVHRPDVVVFVDADRVREFEAVIALADFLDEGAVLVEFEQARRVAAVIDEDVALRVGGDGDRFAQVLSGRKLQKIRDGGEGDFRHARDRRLLLGGRGTGQEQDGGAGGKQMSCHGREPIPGLPSVQSGSAESPNTPT